MIKKELLKMLDPLDDDKVVICMDEFGGWDNIERVVQTKGEIIIVFGGGSPFSDE